MNRTVRKILKIFLLVAIIVTTLIFINHFLILTRIFSTIKYQGDVDDIETIIEKSELFDYQKYCKYRDCSGQTFNVNNSDYYYHIESELLDSLKLKIKNDQGKFHVYTFYRHILIYSLEATQESLLYLTYNNVSIIRADYANHTEIFTAHECYDSLFWEENWYLNFTQIPYTPDSSSTIAINNSILVKMNLDYDYYYVFGTGGASLRIEQFLCFNSNFQTIFVYIPLTGLVVASENF